MAANQPVRRRRQAAAAPQPLPVPAPVPRWQEMRLFLRQQYVSFHNGIVSILRLLVLLCSVVGSFGCLVNWDTAPASLPAWYRYQYLFGVLCLSPIAVHTTQHILREVFWEADEAALPAALAFPLPRRWTRACAQAVAIVAFGLVIVAYFYLLLVQLITGWIPDAVVQPATSFTICLVIVGVLVVGMQHAYGAACFLWECLAFCCRCVWRLWAWLHN